MAVDTTPAETARSLLNGIDYSALIGGPLQAAITAQAMAAESTWKFIERVGLTEDSENGTSAKTVSFLYQRDGEMVRLIVPLLSIVPIPLIIIDEVKIAFLANISASGSSTKEDVSAEEIGGELSGQGKVGWGPFSITASLKASYSSKKSSKATQDSRYSVEYTQSVDVTARQADVPAGLATVLNILSEAAGGGTRNGQVVVSPKAFNLNENRDDPDQGARQLLITTTNANGLKVGSKVTFSIKKEFVEMIEILDNESRTPYPWLPNGDLANIDVETSGETGTLSLFVAPGKTPGPTKPPFPFVTVMSDIKGAKEDKFSVAFIPRLGPPPSLTVLPDQVNIKKGSAGTFGVSISSTLAEAADAKVKIITDQNDKIEVEKEISLSENGLGYLNLKLKAGAEVGDTYGVTFEADFIKDEPTPRLTVIVTDK